LVLKFEKKSEENTSSDSDNSEGEEEHEEKQSQSQSSKTENSLSEGKKSSSQYEEEEEEEEEEEGDESAPIYQDYMPEIEEKELERAVEKLLEKVLAKRAASSEIAINSEEEEKKSAKKSSSLASSSSSFAASAASESSKIYSPAEKSSSPAKKRKAILDNAETDKPAKKSKKENSVESEKKKPVAGYTKAQLKTLHSLGKAVDEAGKKGKGGGQKRKRDPKEPEETSMSKMKKIDGNLVKVNKPDAEDTVHLPGFNLAGRPESLKNKDGGVKRNEIKTSGPYHTGNVNTESYWHFVIRSNKNEWIRFNPDSISVLVYGTHDNPTHEAASPEPRKKSAKWALQAGLGNPYMYIDPSVMGTGFVYRCDVSINNVPVPTNSAIGGLLLHYVRCARVFNHQAKDFFSTNKDVNIVPAAADGALTRASLTAPMKKAVSAFDYFDPLTNKGTRIPIYLDGQFPFDRRNATLESIDKQKEQNLFFPPDTTVEIKLHLYRGKQEAIFHHQLTLPDYFSTEKEVVDAPNADILLTFQDVTLEYES
ncbi:hypothetical protein DAPPUDRAFT_123463, partial [Daphnia pulex]